MKVFCATLIHETNRASPIPTALQNYREDFLYLPSSGEGHDWQGVMLDGVDWGSLAAERGLDIAWGLLAGAEPSAPTDAASCRRLRDELIDSLKQAMPVDMVALFLHGAQVAEGVDDVAGDILAAVRSVTGVEMPLGVVFDLHGNISGKVVQHADAALACLEYPHVDFQDRAGQLLDILTQAVQSGCKPVTIRRRVPMIGTYYTTREPMRSLVDQAAALEGRGGIAAISLVHGFAAANTADCGACILVCGTDPGGAEQLADTLAERWFGERLAIRSPLLDATAALDQAFASKCRPVIVADTKDNPGSGTAGDGTHLLRTLIERQPDVPAAFGMIWDPIAADFASRAGEGARLQLRLGGKAGPASGDPVDLLAEVEYVREDATQMVQGRPHPLGLTATLRCGNLRIIVNSIRQQVFDPACFESMGVRIAEQHVIVVKSMQHFHERFALLAGDILYATTHGAEATAVSNIPRPMWPLDEPPFTAFGRNWS